MDIQEQISNIQGSVDEITETVNKLEKFLIGDKIADRDSPSLLDEHLLNTKFREDFSMKDFIHNTKFRKDSKKWIYSLASLFVLGIFKEWVPGMAAWIGSWF